MADPPPYYAYRKGAELPALEYSALRRLVCNLLAELDGSGWFQDSLGKDCTDAPVDVGGRVLREFGYEFWPLADALRQEDEDWLFSGIEFAYRHIAKPTQSWVHGWNHCGVHVTEADHAAGRRDFQNEVNSLLERYTPSYVLADDGLIYAMDPPELAEIETLQPPLVNVPEVDDRVASARRAFTRYGATDDDKRHAVRNLADVLEHLRATGGTGLVKKDEAELFTIANSFGIRHHRPDQKTEYQTGPWLDWIYFSFLNSIHLINRLHDPGE